MTKTQNTTSEHLTEQWKKGELPEGYYYYICLKDKVIPAKLSRYGNFYLTEGTCGHNGLKPKEVLAPVPSYSEYLALQSDSLAKNEAVEINAELEAENAKLKEEYEAECHRSDELEDSLHIAWKDIDKLKKQLAIAVEALKTIEQKSDKFDDSWGIQEQLDFIKAEAQSKLYEIKELDK